MLDVSAWKVYFEGAKHQKFLKKEAHRALDDIKGSIEELKFYNVQLYQSDNVSNIVPQYNIRHTIYGSDKFCYFL